MATTGAQRVHAIFKIKAEGRTRLVVFDTQDLTLGRAPDNDLAVDDPEISRKHCVFKRTPQGCVVEDMGTSNGTGVNGESVDRAALSNGDVVRIGAVEITYAETTRSPATLGASVEYASQLKSFRANVGAADGDATMLGLMDTVSPGDDFEVRPAGEFAYDLHGMESPPGAAPRNLDAELESLENDPVDDFQFDEADGETQQAADRPAPAAKAAAKPAAKSGAKPASSEVWELEEDDAAAPSAAPAGRLSLSLEIEGLEGELRRIVEGLRGKVLELPRMRVKIKGGDLG